MVRGYMIGAMTGTYVFDFKWAVKKWKRRRRNGERKGREGERKEAGLTFFTRLYAV